MDGGIISGVRVAGGSTPFSFCWTKYMARANCSLLIFPTPFVSQRVLRREASFSYWEPDNVSVFHVYYADDNGFIMSKKLNQEIKPKLHVKKNQGKENESDIMQSICILIHYLSILQIEEKIQSILFKNHIYQFHWQRGYKQRLILPTCQNYMGANFLMFYVMTHQMWARVVLGRPLCRKMLRISSPDTKPSMSVSAVLNIWSNFILSTGFTTHWMAICKNQTTQVIARSVHTTYANSIIIIKGQEMSTKLFFKVTSKMLFDWFFFFLCEVKSLFQTTGVYKSKFVKIVHTVSIESL